MRHSTLARNSATDAVLALLGENALLVLRTASNHAVARLRFSRTAFTPAVGGTAIAYAIGPDKAAAGSQDAVAEVTFETADGVEIVRIPLGPYIDIDNGTIIARGDTVTCKALTYTALPE